MIFLWTVGAPALRETLRHHAPQDRGFPGHGYAVSVEFERGRRCVGSRGCERAGRFALGRALKQFDAAGHATAKSEGDGAAGRYGGEVRMPPERDGCASRQRRLDFRGARREPGHEDVDGDGRQFRRGTDPGAGVGVVEDVPARLLVRFPLRANRHAAATRHAIREVDGYADAAASVGLGAGVRGLQGPGGLVPILAADDGHPLRKFRALLQRDGVFRLIRGHSLRRNPPCPACLNVNVRRVEVGVIAHGHVSLHPRGNRVALAVDGDDGIHVVVRVGGKVDRHGPFQAGIGQPRQRRRQTRHPDVLALWRRGLPDGYETRFAVDERCVIGHVRVAPTCIGQGARLHPIGPAPPCPPKTIGTLPHHEHVAVAVGHQGGTVTGQ